MVKPEKPAKRFTRRTLAKLMMAGAVFAPATWIAALRLKDNPLPAVAQPGLRIEGGLDFG